MWRCFCAVCQSVPSNLKWLARPCALLHEKPLSLAEHFGDRRCLLSEPMMEYLFVQWTCTSVGSTSHPQRRLAYFSCFFFGQWYHGLCIISFRHVESQGADQIRQKQPRCELIWRSWLGPEQPQSPCWSCLGKLHYVCCPFVTLERTLSINLMSA